MREKIKTFLSSGPFGAVVGVISSLAFAFLKSPVVSMVSSTAGLDPLALEGTVMPLGAFPIYFGAAMLFGYIGGLFGGLLPRRKLGIVLGGILGGLLLNIFITLK